MEDQNDDKNYGLSNDTENDPILKEFDNFFKNSDNTNDSNEQDSTDEIENIVENEVESEVENEVESEVENELNKKEEQINEADLFREKYYLEKKKRKNVYADRQKLEQENQELKKLLDTSVNNSTVLYGKDLYKDLDKIKFLKKQAISHNDLDLQLDADELYMKSIIKINEFEAMMAKNSLKENKENKDNEVSEDYEDYNEVNYQEAIERANEWLEDRPELIEGSKSYNPKIQQELGEFVQVLDNELRRKGRGSEILSDNYLEVLDEFVDNIKVKLPKNGYVTSKVGAVRNSFPNNKVTITLTQIEKNFARDLGITEAQAIKYKIDGQKIMKNNN